MSTRVAKFEKVSFAQFKADLFDCCGTSADSTTDNFAVDAYEAIRLPERATKHSAGYDFFTPVDIHIGRGEVVKIPTGIRCSMFPDYVLMLSPRSSLGFKYGTRLMNTTGIVDADYYFAQNEGHILLCMTADRPVDLTAGQKIAQGIFLPFGLTLDDDAREVRHGGFGSTGK